MDKKILGVIPARYASTRFPGKPLALIKEKTMIQHVYENALKFNGFTELVVATDDERILAEVTRFGGKAILTSPDHASGTDRCLEVLEKLPNKYDILINIQGDEPGIKAAQIQELISLFKQSDVEIATLKHLIYESDEILNPNCVKVVCNSDKKALYFSRSPIPFNRSKSAQYFKHIGLYAFKVSALKKINTLPPCSLEIDESLEQLRWLYNGLAIYVNETQHQNIGIDTPEQLKEFEQKFL